MGRGKNYTKGMGDWTNNLGPSNLGALPCHLLGMQKSYTPTKCFRTKIPTFAFHEGQVGMN